MDIVHRMNDDMSCGYLYFMDFMVYVHGMFSWNSGNRWELPAPEMGNFNGTKWGMFYRV